MADSDGQQPEEEESYHIYPDARSRTFYSARCRANLPDDYQHDKSHHAQQEGTVNIPKIGGGLPQHDAPPPEIDDDRQGYRDSPWIFKSHSQHLPGMSEPPAAEKTVAVSILVTQHQQQRDQTAADNDALDGPHRQFLLDEYPGDNE